LDLATGSEGCWVEITLYDNEKIFHNNDQLCAVFDIVNAMAKFWKRVNYEEHWFFIGDRGEKHLHNGG
jgi:hypothetical protein